MNRQTSLSPAKRIACIGMLTAVCYVITLLCQLIPPVAGFLSFDFKDVVVAIGGFIFGPLTALALAFLPSFLEFLTYSSTGPVGLLMNVLSTAAFVLPAALVYRLKRSRSGAVLGLVCGVVIMTIAMLLWNYLVTPGYMKVERAVVEAMLLPVFLPFNLAKGAINTVLTILLYKPVVGALRKARLAPPSREE